MPQLPQTGDQFGRYRIDAPIGQGGMGVVLSATDIELDRRVALKVLSPVLTGTEEFHQRFQREASVLARLSSPHVIDIYDYGIHDDCPYIATQFVGGGDVGALMAARGPMPPQLAARVCAQVADALSDAHRVGVVHRDVKPSNVLLRDANTVDLHAYLCDFGIARAENDGLTTPGSVAGTWSYLSPEGARGERATEASDVYSVGCLFWATLTGHPPYRGSTDVEIAMAHQQRPAPQLEPVDDFAAHANAILARAMAKRPEDRFADADQLRSALLAAAATPTTGIRPAQEEVPPVVPDTVARGSGRRAAADPTPAPPPPPGTPTADAALSPGGPGGPGHPGAPPPGAPLPPFGASSGSRSRRGPLVAAAVVVVLLLIVAGVVGVRALGGDDGGGGGGGPAADDGPVTGDIDGDGLGDLQVVLIPKLGGGEYGRDLWTGISDGESFATPERADDPVDDPNADRRRRDIGDLDGDGKNEVVVATQTTGPGDYDDGPVTVTADLSGGGTLDQELQLSSPAGVTATYVADVDGDGVDDVLTAAGTEDGLIVQARLSDGEGGLSDPVSETTFPLEITKSDEDGQQIEIGDYDGDGKADVVTLVTSISGGPSYDHDFSSTLSVYRGTGTDFEKDTGTQELTTGAAPDLSFDTGDFDGDGSDELVLDTNLSQKTIGLQVFDYDGGLQAPTEWGSITPASSRTNYNGLGISDVNGDGKDDVLDVDAARSTAARTVALVALSDGGSFGDAEDWARWQAVNAGFAVPAVTGAVYP